MRKKNKKTITPLIALVTAVVIIFCFLGIGLYYTFTEGDTNTNPQLICTIVFLVIILLLTEFLMKPKYRYLLRTKREEQGEEREEKK